MAKFCTNCGNQVDDNAIVCIRCGSNLNPSNINNVSQNKKTNGFAVAGFVLSFFFSLLGLIFSIIGLKKSKETNSGRGLSIAGIVISIISMLLSVIMVITVPVIINSMDNLKEDMQQEICPKAHNCTYNYDGTYDCKYVNNNVEYEITCDSKYMY